MIVPVAVKMVVLLGAGSPGLRVVALQRRMIELVVQQGLALGVAMSVVFAAAAAEAEAAEVVGLGLVQLLGWLVLQ